MIVNIPVDKLVRVEPVIFEFYKIFFSGFGH